MSDKEKLLTMLESFGVSYHEFTERMYIYERAWRLGARSSITIRGHVDFHFTEKGQFVGSSSMERRSFIRGKK
jgi:hypothetical protein